MSDQAQFKTLLGRQVAMTANNIFKTRPPTFQCAISNEPHGSDMKAQMVADVRRMQKPTARMCQLAVDAEDEMLQKAKQDRDAERNGRDHKALKMRATSYECALRHAFVAADDSTMLRQMGLPKFDEADSSAPITPDELNFLTGNPRLRTLN